MPECCKKCGYEDRKGRVCNKHIACAEWLKWFRYKWSAVCRKIKKGGVE